MMSSPALQPPSPKGPPLVGDALRYLANPMSYMVAMRQQHGAVVRLPLPVFMPLLISDPALIEHVLVTDNKSYIKDVFLQRLSRDVLGQGLLTSDGDFWRRQRRLAQPAFHRERLAEYADLMSAAAMEYTATLRPGELRDLHQDMMRLTLQIVSRALFSTDVGDMAEEVGHSLDTIMNRYANGAFMLFPFLGRLPLPANHRFAAAVAKLDSLLYGIIRRRRGEGSDRGDLLSMLLRAQDEDGSVMTDKQLRDEVITLFAAGHETTALVMSYTFLLLTQHPQAVAELHAELARVAPDRPPTYADLPSLRYTEAVVLESMRLYPPAWGIGRQALRDTEVAGYHVPKGSQVWMSQWVVHRDPALFPHPEQFHPERWIDGLQRRLPRFAYFPFGGGPRLCIGNSFAMVEATLLLATIARRFRLQVVEEPPIPLLPSITLRPRVGLHARVEAV